MNKQQRIMNRALPLVASSIGGKFGIEISVGGTSAYTNGKSIVIPHVDIKNQYDEEVVWGYLTHEAAHVRYTTFGEKTKKREVNRELHHTIMNILEDGRIELELRKPYPGVEHTLYLTLKRMFDEGKMDIDPNAQPPQALLQYLLMLVRYNYVGQDFLAQNYQASETVLNNLFPQLFVKKLNDLIKKAWPMLASTRDVVKLADKIYDLLRKEYPPEKQDQDQSDDGQDGQGQGSGQDQDQSSDGQDGQGQGSGQDQDQSSDGQDGQGQGSGQDQDQSSDGQDGQGQGSGSGKNDALKACLDAHKSELGYQDIFKEIAENFTERAGKERFGKDGFMKPILASSKVQVGEPLIPFITREHVANFIFEARSCSSKLSAQLRRIVQSETMSKRRSSRAGRRIASSRLSRLTVGNSKIFEKKTEKKAPNTAIQFCLDVSGSMDGQRIHVAKKALISLLGAIHPIKGVSASACSFPHQNRHAGIFVNCSDYYSCVDKLLNFGENPAKRLSAIAQLQASGGTPMHQALMFAATELGQRREQTKVIIVITDGEPNNELLVKHLIDAYSASGIKMIGIGIGARTGYVRDFFEVSAVINDLSQLQPALFDIAQELILN